MPELAQSIPFLYLLFGLFAIACMLLRKSRLSFSFCIAVVALHLLFLDLLLNGVYVNAPIFLVLFSLVIWTVATVITGYLAYIKNKQKI